MRPSGVNKRSICHDKEEKGQIKLQNYPEIELILQEAGHAFQVQFRKREIEQGKAESGQSQKKRYEESLRSKVLRSLQKEPLSKSEIANTIGTKQITGQPNRVVRSLIKEGIAYYTIPGKPNSRLQKYRLKGKTD